MLNHNWVQFGGRKRLMITADNHGQAIGMLNLTKKYV
jgi:hypothetical protein